jgi:hypothetical protein
MPSREKAYTAAPLLSGSAFSPVRFVDEIWRNTGMFRYFGVGGGGISLQFRPLGGGRGNLWLKLVNYLRPNWFARDCLPSAQSKIEAFSRNSRLEATNSPNFSLIVALLADELLARTPVLWASAVS